jgi:hypothetical protein
VLTAVDLDHQALLKADEVENVGVERDLPAKLESGELPVPEQAPHCRFRIRRFVPHILRELAKTFGDWPMGWFLRHEPLTRLSMYPPVEMPSPTRGEGAVAATFARG